MGLLGGLSWNVAHSCVVKENILLEYGYVTPQISPNLMLSTNINLNLIEYVMAGPTEIGRHGYSLSGGGHMNFLNRGKAGPEEKHMGPFL